MRKFRRLTQGERYQIQSLRGRKFNVRSIAFALGRSPSTISRELRRNSGSTVYDSEKAQKFGIERRVSVGPKQKIVREIRDEVVSLLSIQMSPEQIAGLLGLRGIKLSHETIYRFIFKDAKKSGLLYLNLRRRRRYRRSRATSRKIRSNGYRRNQDSIDDRPSIVEERRRLGDFERDTVLGKFGGPILLTIVDRTSRKVWIEKLSRLNSNDAHFATVQALQSEKVKTITNDNGPEFGLHSLTAEALKTKVYFNHPYCSWQRGTNENTNGLIRQYYPKGHDFNLVTDEQIKVIENRLNNRPRKTLGYRTPNDVHRELSRCCI